MGAAYLNRGGRMRAQCACCGGTPSHTVNGYLVYTFDVPKARASHRCTFCRADLPASRVKRKACPKCEQEFKDGYALAERMDAQ